MTPAGLLAWALPFLLGLLLGSLVTACLILPAVGRTVARILAVILLGTGAGLLAWTLALVYREEPLRGPFGSNVITQASEGFGWSAGLLVGGVVAVLLSFLRSGKRSGLPTA